MHVDLSSVAQALVALCAAAVTAAAPFVAAAIQRYLKVKLTKEQADQITAAATRGAALAYGFMVENKAVVGDVPIRNAAIATGVNYVVARLPDAMHALGLTPEHVESIVTAEFGKLLAADPGVTLGAPGASSPPAAAPRLIAPAQPIPVSVVGDPAEHPA